VRYHLFRSPSGGVQRILKLRADCGPTTSSDRFTRLIAATGAGFALVVATALLLWEPLSGATALSLPAGHGVGANDLVALTVAAAAVAVVRRFVRPLRGDDRARPRWRAAVPASLLVLGLLLVPVAFADVAGRGSLVPAGGGTVDGVVDYATAPSALPVGVWSHLALTYDGAAMRLFVDGVPVSHRAATGAVPSTGDPLWIGGNQPFGEHFEGVIDEVRVYDRTLDAGEIRADMATPVHHQGPTGAGPASTPIAPVARRGLVGAYPFAEGAGRVAADASRHDNAGRIVGASWTTGRFGSALRFDGTDDVVRVPAAESLDLEERFTLSAWLRPTAPREGWRTIIYRETDVYFLDGGSDVGTIVWPGGETLAYLVAVAVLGCAMAAVVAGGRRSAAAGPAWATGWVAGVAMLAAGLVIDTMLAPSPTTFGPLMLAVWWAATASRRSAAAIGWLVALALVGVTVAALVDSSALATLGGREDGSVARSGALGVTLVVIGVVEVVQAARRRRHPRGVWRASTDGQRFFSSASAEAAKLD
jgi:hypothetical protein